VELKELLKQIADEHIEQSKRDLANGTQKSWMDGKRARESAEIIIAKRLNITLEQLREQLKQEGNDAT
jgi:hypothetical protein